MTSFELGKLDRKRGRQLEDNPHLEANQTWAKAFLRQFETKGEFACATRSGLGLVNEWDRGWFWQDSYYRNLVLSCSPKR